MTSDFPVLSAGSTPHDQWDIAIVGEVDEPRRWSWDDLRALPSDELMVDIHCVTKWSKLDTVWQGVSVDVLLEGIDSSAEYVSAWSDGGYTTNLRALPYVEKGSNAPMQTTELADLQELLSPLTRSGTVGQCDLTQI